MVTERQIGVKNDVWYFTYKIWVRVFYQKLINRKYKIIILFKIYILYIIYLPV